MVEPARARIVLRIQAEGLRREFARRDLKPSVQVLVHLSAATTCVQQPCASWECPPKRAFQVRPDDSLPVNRGGHFIEEPRPRRFPLPVAIPLLGCEPRCELWVRGIRMPAEAKPRGENRVLHRQPDQIPEAAKEIGRAS